MLLGGVLASIWLYSVFKLGTIRKGKLKNSVMFLLLCLVLMGGAMFNMAYIGNIIATILVVLFDLFYDEEPFFNQWKWLVGLGIGISGLLLLYKYDVIAYEVTLMVASVVYLYMILSAYTRLLFDKANLLILLVFSGYIFLAYYLRETWSSLLVLLMSIATLVAIDLIREGYNKSFERKTTKFQQDLLINQYEEVKTIYLNMRGFRHDYHNHIQVLKAHMYMEQIEELYQYLLQLEGELQRIDSSVRCGNLMMDAILNSKIAVARQHDIAINCQAELPEKLPLSDVDLCVIMGNLLDNAIEACQKIEEGRFIRIYSVILKNQLYISIQNAAKEALNFEERHYISTKRGNHGLGMKRVKVLVDKYEGFLNLQNEPGVFAAEVTLPLVSNAIVQFVRNN